MTLRGLVTCKLGMFREVISVHGSALAEKIGVAYMPLAVMPGAIAQCG